MSEAQGGKFINGFASGALSSVAASLWQGGSTSGYKWEGGLDGGLEFSVRNYQGISGFLGAKNGVGTVLFGAIAGGAGADFTGGNFWQGAVTGGIVSGLNHEMHDGGGKFGDPKKNQNDFYKKLSENLDGFGIGNDIKLAIMNLGKGDFTSFTQKYVKTLSSFGTLAGVGSTILSIKAFTDNPSTVLLVKSFFNIVSISYGPWGGFAYGIFDSSEIGAQFYENVGNFIDQTCDCKAGAIIYNSSKDIINKFKN